MQKKFDVTQKIKTKYSEIYKKIDKEDEHTIKFSNFKTNKKKVLIIGNSHAEDLYSTLKLLENKLDNLEFGYYQFQNNINIKKFLKKKVYINADIIIYTRRYDLTIKQEINQLEKLIDQINYKKKFILINNSPEFFSRNLTVVEYILSISNLNKMSSKGEIIHSINRKSFELLSNKKKQINNELKKFSKKNNLIFYDNYEVTCEIVKKLCYVIDEDFNQLYADYGHLTKKGHIFFSEKIYRSKWLIKSLF